MSKGSTLYRFKVSLSDVDRAVYENLDFRLAMHASESEEYLVTRVLAYILNYADGVEFSQGLATPDDPSIFQKGEHGAMNLWIDIGNPTARRIHKASKSSPKVRIYTYKDPENLIRETKGETIHQAEKVELFSFEPAFLKTLIATLGRDNEWVVIQNDGELSVMAGDESLNIRLENFRLM